MTGKSPGRELAIETLIDTEPQGAFYRASRILEEAVPESLASRPNLVTRSALVEQAHALEKYEINTVQKYNTLFGGGTVFDSESSLDSQHVNRILLHHATLKKSPPAPPQLVSALRNVCPLDSIRSLLKTVMTHKAMEEDAESSFLENMIANVCRMACLEQHTTKRDTVLNGLLIASLFILTGSILCTEEDTTQEGPSLKKTTGSTSSGEYLDPVMPALQVGSVLSLLQCKNDTTSDYHLDLDILEYLGKAASVYQQGVEIKKSHMAKQEKNHRGISPIPIVPLTPTGTNEEEEEQADEEEEGGSDSESTDDSEERYNPEGLVPHEQDVDQDDSSSSSSDSEGDPQHIELINEDDDVIDEDDDDDDEDFEDDEDEEEESDIEEEDDMLREALALSLVDQGPAFEAVQQEVETSGNNDNEEESANDNEEESANDNEEVEQGETVQEETAQEQESESTSPVENLFATPPATEASKLDAVEEDDSTLPQLPPAPSHYPYATLLSSLSDVDLDRNEAKDASFQRERSEYLDPAELSKFGAVPSSHALVHLLRYLIFTIQQEREQNKAEDKTVKSIPGGMGSSLFEPRILPFANDTKGERTEDYDNAVTVQLLMSTFLILDQNRRHAIENLRHAIAAEQRNLQGEDGSDEEDDSPLSAEDDPALALAMNYVEDDVYLEEDVPSDTAQSTRSESLENKGMRRKAAAAAHDAAARLKSLRKQTEAWRDRVKLLSQCTLMSMKCLREYLRSTVSLRLQRSSSLTESALSDPPVSVLAFEKLMPPAMIARLSESLDSLMSIASFRSYASLVSGEDPDEMENIFFPLRLYKEALSTWGECLPVLHPSDAARFEVLSSTLEGYISVAAVGTVTSDPDLLEVLPLSDSEVQLHKLQLMCRRFCVSDLLDGLVARPVCYSAEDTKTKIDLFGEGDDASTAHGQASKLIKLVGLAAGSCPQHARDDLQRLYLALCHRCNVQILLWNGLYASSDVESDGIAGSSSAAGSAADVIRVSPNPSSNLQFDPTKCSDSIAILSSDSPSSTGGPSAHQRASKVWGAVLSSSFYSPKTGVHRWAVRLDKCERGHVFVGVATSQASTRTYVGGDKYGWGVIGTQALWHDRRKIRGDYGATFRTGSTIIVTLDTDAGTLSFSTWKDSSNSSSSFSLDPSLQSGSSPTRRIAGGGTIEDWGVAFEGLPLDSRLYPAVGLYQRDDRVTLLNVESGGPSSGRDGVIDGGLCYYPSVPEPMTASKPDLSRIAHVKMHNDILSWDGILYVTQFLRSLSESLRSPDEGNRKIDLLCSVIPSIAAALSLLPTSIPMLSSRFGVVLLPHLSRCIQDLHSTIKAHRLLFSGLRQGKWIIRATGSAGTVSRSSCEEYVVDFVKATEAGDAPFGFHGTGVGTTGKSKNGLVSIVGATSGSAVHFVEEWTDGNEEVTSSEASTSSCVVTARINLDGSKFEGAYSNVQTGTSGQISGILTAPSLLEEEKRKELKDISLKCEALLCLAHGHLATILAEDIAGDHACRVASFQPEQLTADEWQNQCSTLKEWVSSPLLANGPIDRSDEVLSRSLDKLRKLYASPEMPSGFVDHGVLGSDCIVDGALYPADCGPPPNLASSIDKIDDSLTPQSGGKGSLASICPQEYSATRKKVICALAYHSNVCQSITDLSEHLDSAEAPCEELISLWRGSLRIMEDSIRRALSSSHDTGRTRKEVTLDTCEKVDRISNFLLKMAAERGSTALSLSTVVDGVASFCAAAASEADLVYLQAEMECSTKRAVLRMCALKEVALVLTKVEDSEDAVVIECIASVLPRLMGRSWAKAGRTNRDTLGGRNDLGTYYLSQLSGGVSLPSELLRDAVSSVYGALGRLLGQYSNGRKMEDSSTNSLIQSILVAYVMTIRAADVPSVLSDHRVFGKLTAVLMDDRDSVHTTGVTVSADSDKTAAIQNIYEIIKRDTSRAVLRTASYVVHVMAFQLSRFASQASQVDAESGLAQTLKNCLEMVFDELSISIPLIESSVQEQLGEYTKLLASDDWESWCGACLPGGSRLPTSRGDDGSSNKLYKAGIAYLNENGVGASLIGNHPSSQKASPRAAALVSSNKAAARSDCLGVMLTFWCQQYLTQWLHILACVFKSQHMLKRVAEDWKLTDVLLRAIGLSCERNANGALTSVCVRNEKKDAFLPARYRARMLRLVRGLLVLTSPSEVLVEGLLSLGGSTTVANKSRDSDDGFVSREAVSLLRHLHLPAFPRWRECVLRVICRHIDMQDGQNKNSLTDMALGARLFLGGPVNALGRGSYVLLKPPAAVSLSPEAQSSPSSKSHTSSGNSGPPSGGISPHHIAGNGTEGIVSGLCRSDAAAGIVSNVLVKNGVCEVILMNRHQLPSAEDAAPVLNKKGSSSSRRSLTVRALRTPLADVALAEEVPLILDSSINVQGLLGPSLSASLDVIKCGPSVSSLERGDESDAVSEDRSASDEKSLCAALATLRSALAVTSSKEILQILLKAHSSSNSLARVLSLASDGDALREIESREGNSLRSESLSELPKHEAQYAHLTAMLRELKLRREVLDSIPMSFWEKKLADQRDAREVASAERATDNVGDSGGVSTPPASSSPESDTRASLRALASDLGDDEGRRGESARMVSQSTVSSNNSTDEDEDGEAAATAAAHLREAAIAQMAELGLPRSWSELALRRTGGTNIEAAVHFCLERGGDMERLIAEEQERERMVQRQSSGGSASRRRSSRAESANHLLSQLLEMGFPRRWCAEALAATGNNVDEALTWILTNGERLSAEDLGMEEEMGDVEDDDDDDEDSAEDDDEEHASETGEDGATEPVETSASQANAGNEAASASAEAEVASDRATAEKSGWSGPVCPLRFISGRSMINSKTLCVSGLPAGGFSSVGTKGILLTSGKWYYEAILETAGCLQIGWADGSFSGHCNADRGDGCGDGPSSWAFDGWRRYRWHASATEWGCRWKEGDVIGCLVDLDDHIVSFTLNGQAEEIGMGVAFSGQGFRPCGGVYACVSFNRREKLRLILGGESSEAFQYQPPPGYKGVGEAVLDAVSERDTLLMKENILLPSTDRAGDEDTSNPKRFLCDFSDGEHGHELFAWQHRYYGSDASVHLGSARHSKQSSDSKKSGSGTSFSTEMSALLSISRRVEREWKREGEIGSEELAASDTSRFVSRVKEGYEKVIEKLNTELRTESVALGIIYCRKLILHLMVTLGKEFDLRHFFPSGNNSNERECELMAARCVWSVLDTCVSLRSAGWVGEAGAMAVAAEALGLGISSAHARHTLSETRTGVPSSGQSDDSVALPSAGISQILSTVLLGPISDDKATSSSLAACAEAAIGSGGSLVFLQPSLQSLISRSPVFQDLLVAVVRRSVRLLAVVDYSGEDSSEHPEDEEIDSPSSPFGGSSRSRPMQSEEDLSGLEQPDARLTLFVTGLLLSGPVILAPERKKFILESLFEAWSVGLLSASAPWRMVCALSAAGILNLCPHAVLRATECLPTVSRFYSRLHSTVSRRIWAERAAVPVCSRYSQALAELLVSVRRAIQIVQPLPSLFCEPLWVDAATPISFNGMSLLTEEPSSEASSPEDSSWEWEDGWLSSDAGWEVWTGTVECMAVDWKAPSRSAVRTLMDGGEGPPMLRVGCKVMRGLDWGEEGSGSSLNGNDDGKEAYDAEKAEREKEKRALEEERDKEGETQETRAQSDNAPNNAEIDGATDPTADQPAEESAVRPPSPEEESAQADTSTRTPDTAENEEKKPNEEKKQKRRPKLPVGTVLSIEPWKGIPAMARRVKWDLTGIEGVYRYGGDGGRYDISHVEVNKKSTRVRKRHPLPESAEQCAFRHGFGVERKHSVLLRLRRKGEEKIVEGELEYHHQGVLEWPGFGAAVRVDCILHPDGAVTLTEKELLYGSKDAGWEARFGQPSFVSGTVMVMTPTGSLENQSELDTTSSLLSLYEELLGSSCFTVEALRDRANGRKVRVTSEMRLLRSRRIAGDSVTPIAAVQAPVPPPIRFDTKLHAPSISLSRDGRTITCVAPDGRGTAYASTGFMKGVHYWEVKLEQADVGSIFIGVAEKPSASGSGGSPFGQESQPRLNRWHGWGFVNFRATYSGGAERVYGAHCHAGDTVGVLLDCDAGRVSFFCDGLKYGEHILNDLGCAFENLSPFGFNADGCGSGGAGQGAPSGVEGGRGGRYPAQGSVRARALWPVIGLRNPGDRVTISTKWMTSPGIDGPLVLKNITAVDELLVSYDKMSSQPPSQIEDDQEGTELFPDWFVKEAFSEYERWRSGRWFRSVTRGSGPQRMASFGLDVDLDTSPLACASACACLGLKQALLPGDRVMVKRSAGRMLELPEEATILGSHQGRLFYRIVSQKSEGGSLTEGGGRAWFWDESEVVDDGVELIGEGKGIGIPLPTLHRFSCLSAGGLRIVYEGGAVVRSDLEIFDGSVSIGSVPLDTVIPQKDVLERRVNSCGVVRFRIRYGEISNGWISAWIRGGKEEAIVEPVKEKTDDEDTTSEDEDVSRVSYGTPLECAEVWYREYSKKQSPSDNNDEWAMKDLDEFKTLLSKGLIPGMSSTESDMLLVSAVGAIADFSESGDAVDCSFDDIAGPVALAVASANGTSPSEQVTSRAAPAPGANQAALTELSNLNVQLPETKALLARTAMLRALNRRVRLALPWLSVRPSQEGNAIFGGLSGHGASIDRVGRYRLLESLDQWVQVPSIGSRVRSFRRLFFTCVKRSFLESIMETTTTPTPLSHDEYELPREIRTVRINRLKARRAMEGSDTRTKRKHSAFSQLQSETRSWGGAALRRGFVAKGHGGQKRAFKVKLIGEGVNDYSGPYREAFTDAMQEVSVVDENGRGALGVLDATPNNASQIGDHRELFMFSTGDRDLTSLSTSFGVVTDEEAQVRNSFASLTMPRDEVSREVEESLVFLGRLVGTACRHGIPVDLPLPLHAVWKAIAEESSSQEECMRELDLLASRQLVDSGSTEKPMILQWQQRMLNSFMDGLSNVFPDEILTLMTGEEIRDVLCGNSDIDVDLLRRVVEYEGYDEDDEVIQYFWEALREMDSDERKKFLQFVWARNRLPMKESAFDAPFKIQKDTASAGGSADAALPSASTCFFSLTLPEYSSKEILKRKLLFAIENVVTMESDYVTNDAEVGEGWRGV